MSQTGPPDRPKNIRNKKGRMTVKKETILIIGGGYAGIHMAEALDKQAEETRGSLRVVLIDRTGSHFRKVRLVQAPVEPVRLAVPLEEFGWKHVEVLRAELTGLDPAGKTVRCKLPDGTETELAYDRLILALGSIPRPADANLGGFSLRDAEQLAAIRQGLEQQIWLAGSGGASPEERRSLLRAAVIGGGISGIETAAELAAKLGRERERLGAADGSAPVVLVHVGPRLLPEASARVSRQLERRLRKLGVETLCSTRAERVKDGVLHLADGRRLPAPIGIWTLGIEPSPLPRALGLPVHADGRLLTDPWYRVQGYDTIYAIGDCARSCPPNGGTADGMTCKEAIPQARRLADILKTGRSGGAASPHTPVDPMFCVGLGTGEGFVWIRKWGLDLVLTGKLGWRVREWTWTAASLGK